MYSMSLFTLAQHASIRRVETPLIDEEIGSASGENTLLSNACIYDTEWLYSSYSVSLSHGAIATVKRVQQNRKPANPHDQQGSLLLAGFSGLYVQASLVINCLPQYMPLLIPLQTAISKHITVKRDFVGGGSGDNGAKHGGADTARAIAAADTEVDM